MGCFNNQNRIATNCIKILSDEMTINNFLKVWMHRSASSLCTTFYRVEFGESGIFSEKHPFMQKNLEEYDKNIRPWSGIKQLTVSAKKDLF